MGKVFVCDADRKTILNPDEVCYAGWGKTRVYSVEASQVVDEYSKAVLSAAAEARKVFRVKRYEARQEFFALYPGGLLPDSEDEASETPPITDAIAETMMKEGEEIPEEKWSPKTHV